MLNPHTNIGKNLRFEYAGFARTPTAYWYDVKAEIQLTSVQL